MPEISAIQDLIKNLPLFSSLGSKNYWEKHLDSLKKYQNYLILGTGGSILTTQALLSIAPNNNMMCLDNIDPHTLNDLCNTDLSKTGIIVISKSGNTSEIICQILTLLEAHPHITDQVTVITEQKESLLFDLAQQFGWTTIPHPSDIGGRFSAFTAVGCLPCALMGLDPQNLIKGAQETLEAFTSGKDTSSWHDAIQFSEGYKQGVRTHILWGYSDFFGQFTGLVSTVDG